MCRFCVVRLVGRFEGFSRWCVWQQRTLAVEAEDDWLAGVDLADCSPAAKLPPAMGKATSDMLTPTSVLDSNAFDLGDLPTFTLYGESQVDWADVDTGSSLTF